MSNRELAKSQKIDARIVQTVRSLRQSSNIRKPNTSSMQSKPQIRNEIRHPGTANTKIYSTIRAIYRSCSFWHYGGLRKCF